MTTPRPATAAVRQAAAHSQRAEVSPIASETIAADLSHVECTEYQRHRFWHFRDHTAAGHPWRCFVCRPFGAEPER